MNTGNRPDFLVIKDSDSGELTILNINQVISVDEIRSDHCRIVFSGERIVNMNGSGVCCMYHA